MLTHLRYLQQLLTEWWKIHTWNKYPESWVNTTSSQPQPRLWLLTKKGSVAQYLLIGHGSHHNQRQMRPQQDQTLRTNLKIQVGGVENTPQQTLLWILNNLSEGLIGHPLLTHAFNPVQIGKSKKCSSKSTNLDREHMNNDIVRHVTSATKTWYVSRWYGYTTAYDNIEPSTNILH